VDTPLSILILVKEAAPTQIEFHEGYWKNVSVEAKKNYSLLNPDSAWRPTVAEALADPVIFSFGYIRTIDLTALSHQWLLLVAYHSSSNMIFALVYASISILELVGHRHHHTLPLGFTFCHRSQGWNRKWVMDVIAGLREGKKERVRMLSFEDNPKPVLTETSPPIVDDRKDVARPCLRTGRLSSSSQSLWWKQRNWWEKSELVAIAVTTTLGCLDRLNCCRHPIAQAVWATIGQWYLLFEFYCFS